MSLIRKHRAVLQAWACLALVLARKHIYETYYLNFHVNFFLILGVFAPLPPLASAARCGPHPRSPVATPLA